MLLGRGAEAVVRLVDGEVIKERVEKGYRHPGLDERIRRGRNRREAGLMRRARRKLKVPRVLEAGESSIRMEFVDGEVLRDAGLEGLEVRVGEAVGRLHSAGIAHNDLTTSNMILHGEAVWLIDFGLAEQGKVEDFSTDLKVLLEAAEATHAGFSREALLQGYKKTMPDNRKVLRRLEKVYRRGRYIRKPQ